MALPGSMVYLVGSFSELRDRRQRRAVAQLHHALGVRDAGRRAEEHGRVEALGQLEGDLEEILGLAAVGGLDERDLGELGVVAVVLLVLGAVHAGVVGGDQDQPALDAGVGGGEEGIGGHVDAHVLHAHQGAGTGHRRPECPLPWPPSRWATTRCRCPCSPRGPRGSRCWACRDRRRPACTPASQAPRAMASLPERISMTGPLVTEDVGAFSASF